MNCSQKIEYVIRQGDNLFQLSRYYKTTVPDILSLNPAIDPYNLQIGENIIICPGENYDLQAQNSNPPVCPNPLLQIALIKEMRLAWSQHIYWTRMLLISIAERLEDEKFVTDKLLQNPAVIADIFAVYYPEDIAKTIESLLTQHLQIGGELITALRDGKTEEAKALNNEWYRNADDMANAFSSINPYYKHDEVRKMLREHLDLTSHEVAKRLAKDYLADIEAFDKVEQAAMAMADYFSTGIMQQFPQMFH